MIKPFEPYYVTVDFNGAASYGPHEGCDMNGYGNDCGTPLKAIYGGDIVHVSSSTLNYGKLIVLKISGPWGTRYVRYCHLQSIAVNTDQPVKEGDIIGFLGTTGNSTACHLHFDMLLNIPPGNNWRFYSKDVLKYYEDPLKFIEKWGSAIIQPPMTEDEKRALQVLKDRIKTSTDLSNQPFGNLEGYANTLAQDAYRAWKNPSPPLPTPTEPVFNTQQGKLFYQLAKTYG